MAITKGSFSAFALDGKTVHIFAYSSTREQSNKRSGRGWKQRARLGKDACFFFRSTAARLLRHAFTDFFTYFEKKTTVLQCTFVSVTCFLNIAVELKHETLDVWIYVYTNLNVRLVRERLLPTIRFANKNFTVLLIQKYFAHTLMTRQSSLRKSSNILGASNTFLVLRGYIWLYNLFSFLVPLSDLLLRSAFP